MTAQPTEEQIQNAYTSARERYAAFGVNTDEAVATLERIPISLHCWQGDDVGGFETPDAKLSGGGILTTGNYPGKARNADQLRLDLDKAYSLLPGTHRLSLLAMYGDVSGKKHADRNELGPENFARWADWAGDAGRGIDLYTGTFSHPKADDGFTLANQDEGIRQFWIEHCIACRKIGEFFGRKLGTPCVTNVWVPDGYKDTPVDRKGPRMLLKDSLDKIFAGKIDHKYNLDSVECKLFGIGSESYVVGSHEFYLGYAIANGTLLCLDTGHFHPTEVVSDKISSVLAYLDEILLHISRGVRWDSDHVVTLTDELRAVADEIVRGDFIERVHIGLDYFDASINRVAAWVIGARNMIKALLLALLEPHSTLRAYEAEGDLTGRLALMEEAKTLPAGAVWDYYCLTKNVPVGTAWLDDVRAYERDELSKRS